MNQSNVHKFGQIPLCHPPAFHFEQFAIGSLENTAQPFSSAASESSRVAFLSAVGFTSAWRIATSAASLGGSSILRSYPLVVINHPM